jgi:hypothetical protein
LKCNINISSVTSDPFLIYDSLSEVGEVFIIAIRYYFLFLNQDENFIREVENKTSLQKNGKAEILEYSK